MFLVTAWLAPIILTITIIPSSLCLIMMLRNLILSLDQVVLPQHLGDEDEGDEDNHEELDCIYVTESKIQRSHTDLTLDRTAGRAGGGGWSLLVCFY